MKITLFNNDWYADYMNQVMERFGDETSDDARAIASAIMTAGAFIAQSIDMSIGPDEHNRKEGNLTDQIRSLTAAIYDVHATDESGS